MPYMHTVFPVSDKPFLYFVLFFKKMSFRELRNFTEMLRALGYPRLVSIENFRAPNFKLVAEILDWLLKKYDPDSDIPDAIDTEQDRVIFIKTASLFMVQKARIKINPKKLYQADGYAVQEMLKVASILYSAIQQNQTGVVEEDDEGVTIAQLTGNINSKLNELRASRQLATEITDRGASLFDLLSKEVDLKEQRTAALTRPLELTDVEKSLRASIKAVEEEVKHTVHNLDNIAADESTLDTKIDKKKSDLERQQKRLAQLQSVRPAYMDEYEKLENELHKLYSTYVQKFRNLSYLEAMLNEYDKAEMERTTEAEKSLRRVAEKMREEDRARAAAAARLDSAVAMEQGDAEFSPDESPERKQPIRAPLPPAPAPKVYGSMTGAGLSDDDEDGGDSLLSDEDEEDDIVVSAAPGGGPVARKSQQPVISGVERQQPISGDKTKPTAIGNAPTIQKSDELSDVSGDDDEVGIKRRASQRPGAAAPVKQRSDDDDDDF